jgi:4,5:9,10-diseco-3-hydroxy-5,9,17-trioxoandrosta-1(10),2-diene-4-oate hydrolase
MPPARHALGAGPAGRELTVGGVRLAFDDEGDGPPLLCLHAVGHGARDFEPLRERLRGRCRVLALDWPGHGRSGDDAEPAGAARYAALLEGFVDALGLRDWVLLGNSIGGAAALRLAARRPAETRGLVLVDSGGLDRVDLAARLVTRGMAAFFAAGARGARWFPRAFELYYRAVLPAPPARAQRERIVAAAPELAPRLTEAWRSFGEPGADARPLAAGLGCPVLVAWAERDRVLQLRRSLPAIRRIPGARLERFPGGHAPFLECPDAFAAALAGFLDEVWGTERARAGAPAA